MAQLLSASQSMRAAFQLRAGPSTGGGRTRCRQPSPILSSFRASRFADGARRAVRFDKSCGTWGKPRSFYGPRMGFGTGFELGLFGMDSKVSGSDIRELMQNLNDVFGRTSSVGDIDPLTGARRSKGGEAASYLFIPVDVEESEEAYTFTADVPGVLRADTKVQANREERKLTVSGERFAPEQTEESKKRKHNTERRFGKFKRTFKLPKDADLGAISASFRDGVLKVTVKRVKPVEPEVMDVPIDDWFDVEDIDDVKDVDDESPGEE